MRYKIHIWLWLWIRLSPWIWRLTEWPKQRWLVSVAKWVHYECSPNSKWTTTAWRVSAQSNYHDLVTLQATPDHNVIYKPPTTIEITQKQTLQAFTALCSLSAWRGSCQCSKLGDSSPGPATASPAWFWAPPAKTIAKPTPYLGPGTDPHRYWCCSSSSCCCSCWIDPL